MTVPAGETSISKWTGNGSSTVFTYEFTISSASDLLVTVVDSEGASSVLSLNVDYTVTGVGESTGTVITTVPVPDGSMITIEDNVPLSQDIPFGNQAQFFASSHEAAFDKLTRLIKRYNTSFVRAVKIATTDTDIDMTLPLAGQRAGKVFTFGDAGEPLASEVLPDSILFNQATVGAQLYPQTPAEQALGVNPPYKNYPPGNALRYDTPASGHNAIQTAINAASHVHLNPGGGHPAAAYIPYALWDIDDDLYNYYDAVNNPGFSPGVNQAGRIHIYGDLVTGYADLINNRNYGSVLNFAAGKSWKVGRDQGTTGTNSEVDWSQEITRIAVKGNFDGELFSFRGCARSLIKGLTIHNASAGSNAVCFAVTDLYVNQFEDIFVSGPNRQERPANSTSLPGSRTQFAGVGFRVYRNAGAGGNNRFINCNANGFKRGWLIGSDYADIDSAQSFNNIEFFQCQAHFNNVGFDVRGTVYGLIFRQCFTEYNYNDNAGNPGVDYWVHEYAGFSKPDQATNTFGTIVLDSCSSGSSDTLEHYGILAGSDAADPKAAAHGMLVVKDHQFGNIPSNTRPIRRYNSPENGPLYIERPGLSFNGGEFLQLENEPQYAPVEIKGMHGLRWNGGLGDPDPIVVDSGSNDMSRWLGGESHIHAHHGNLINGSPDINLSACFDMNRLIMVTPTASGATHTIKLPCRAGAGNYQVLLTKNNGQANFQFVLDPTAPAWQTATYYVRNQMVSRSGNLYVCIISGTSDTGPSGTSDGQVDGSVTWNCVGNFDCTINGVSSYSSTLNDEFTQLVLTLRCSDGKSRANEWVVSEISV